MHSLKDMQEFDRTKLTFVSGSSMPSDAD